MRLDWSLDINAKAACELMEMAKGWGVESYVHVSTCYVNANRLQPGQKVVKEQLYELRTDPHTILKERESKRNNLNDLALEKYDTAVETIGLSIALIFAWPHPGLQPHSHNRDPYLNPINTHSPISHLHPNPDYLSSQTRSPSGGNSR